jgi:hypothetical protein
MEATPDAAANNVALATNLNTFMRVMQATNSIIPHVLVEGLPLASTGKIKFEQSLADGTSISNAFDFS